MYQPLASHAGRGGGGEGYKLLIPCNTSIFFLFDVLQGVHQRVHHQRHRCIENLHHGRGSRRAAPRCAAGSAPTAAPQREVSAATRLQACHPPPLQASMGRTWRLQPWAEEESGQWRSASRSPPPWPWQSSDLVKCGATSLPKPSRRFAVHVARTAVTVAHAAFERRSARCQPPCSTAKADSAKQLTKNEHTCEKRLGLFWLFWLLCGFVGVCVCWCVCWCVLVCALGASSACASHRLDMNIQLCTGPPGCQAASPWLKAGARRCRIGVWSGAEGSPEVVAYVFSGAAGGKEGDAWTSSLDDNLSVEPCVVGAGGRGGCRLGSAGERIHCICRAQRWRRSERHCVDMVPDLQGCRGRPGACELCHGALCTE